MLINVVADFGADPTGARDSLDAFNAAVAAVGRYDRQLIVIPAGIITFRIPGLSTDRCRFSEEECVTGMAQRYAFSRVAMAYGFFIRETL